MNSCLTQLLSIASQALAAAVTNEECAALDMWGTLGRDLAGMLRERNGFYAFESALLVRPLCSHGSPLGLVEWNDQNLWKAHYADPLADTCFFAEDVFGVQFCIRNGQICAFDPETGQLEAIGASLAEWCSQILSDTDFRTGHPIAHSWQAEHGTLRHGDRLIPKTPFVCGGEYHRDNLYPLNDVKGMRYRASIANQIRDVPDGSSIVISPTKR